MTQMYKVFFDQKQISLTEKKASFVSNEGLHYLFHSDVELRPFIIDFVNQENVQNLNIYGDSADTLFESLRRVLSFRDAAGGIVRNENDEILLIRRNNLWDLPKGHMEAGEQPEETAIRETMEETAVSGLHNLCYFDKTYHLYFIGSKLILKRTWWYAMNASGDQNLQPQYNEGITETKWADPKDLPHIYKNTYLSIAELLTSFLTTKM